VQLHTSTLPFFGGRIFFFLSAGPYWLALAASSLRLQTVIGDAATDTERNATAEIENFVLTSSAAPSILCRLSGVSLVATSPYSHYRVSLRTEL
jgi:hypothetical protein